MLILKNTPLNKHNKLLNLYLSSITSCFICLVTTAFQVKAIIYAITTGKYVPWSNDYADKTTSAYKTLATNYCSLVCVIFFTSILSIQKANIVYNFVTNYNHNYVQNMRNAKLMNTSSNTYVETKV